MIGQGGLQLIGIALQDFEADAGKGLVVGGEEGDGTGSVELVFKSGLLRAASRMVKEPSSFRVLRMSLMAAPLVFATQGHKVN
jgi:hypothetical protein